MSAKASVEKLSAAAVRYQDDTIYLSGSLNFDSVIALNNQVSDWLSSNMPADCVVDLAEVEYSSSVGIALMLGWMRTAGHAGGTLSLRNVPADMLAMAEVGGLSGLFSQQAEK
ncbi:MAG: STAS domain-containing protein [Alcanivoracaceae bacterium]|nr:STAS domain-containing protein [Alcanivoracaceae bacterium]